MERTCRSAALRCGDDESESLSRASVLRASRVCPSPAEGAGGVSTGADGPLPDQQLRRCSAQLIPSLALRLLSPFPPPLNLARSLSHTRPPPASGGPPGVRRRPRPLCPVPLRLAARPPEAARSLRGPRRCVRRPPGCADGPRCKRVSRRVDAVWKRATEQPPLARCTSGFRSSIGSQSLVSPGRLSVSLSADMSGTSDTDVDRVRLYFSWRACGLTGVR